MKHFTLSIAILLLNNISSSASKLKLFVDTVKAVTDSSKYYPCLHNSHNREFDYWIGSWDVYATGTTTLVGYSLVQKESGGCMLLENWTALKNNDGKSINYVDNKTGKWEQDWIGSGGQAQHFVNGVYKNSVMQFEGTSTDQSGSPVTVRFSFFNQGADKVRQLYETSKDGQNWVIGYDLTYIRKK